MEVVDLDWLHEVAKRADDAWQAELVKVYGKYAGDARYTLMGKATPRLAELRAAYRVADGAYLDALAAARDDGRCDCCASGGTL